MSDNPMFDDARDNLAAMAEAEKPGHNKEKLAKLLAGVRARVPAAATTLKLETSDQNDGYGFWIRDVVDSLGNSVVTDEEVDQLNDDLTDELDLDWDSAVGEDKHGYADLNLKEDK